MATWAIGDIQGCHRTFRALLAHIDFQPGRDRLWLAGDLVNRGPDSLAVLRDCVRWREHIVAVLGNHDLHLLARAAGVARAGKRDTLSAVLAAPDRDELLAWLGALPLMVHERGFAMVHAGLLPPWSTVQANRLAAAASRRLRALPPRLGLGGIRGAAPWPTVCVNGDPSDAVDPDALPDAVLLSVVAALTRVRSCDANGRLSAFSGELKGVPPDTRPWFDYGNERWTAGETLYFGHWAALGTLRRTGLRGLDSGCVWGGTLTAACLEDDRWVSVPSQEGV